MLIRPEDHSGAGRIMSLKNSSYIIGVAVWQLRVDWQNLTASILKEIHQV